MAKAGLLDIPISRRRKLASAGKTLETGAVLYVGIEVRTDITSGSRSDVQ
jgi:hypothetical protein